MPELTSLTSGTVTWTIVNQIEGAKARGASGYVEFEASAVATFHGGLTVLPSPQRAEMINGEMTPISLPVNDADVWNWKVTPHVGVKWPPFHVNVPKEGTDLSSAAITPGTGPVRVLQGPQGGSVVGAEDQGDGTIRFVLDDGTRTAAMPITRGPAGPPNKINIGTVTKGETPYASLIGAAPEQTLNLVLPKGDPGDPEKLVDATTERRGLMSAADKIRMASPGVYAVDFGAVGDGVADDSAALSVAAEAAEGGVLHLTAGAVYAVRSKVTLSDGVTIEGHGATLVKPDDATDNLMFVKGSKGIGYGSGGSGITIRDLAVAGNYNAAPGYGDCTSWFHHVDGLVIERCQFSRGVIDGHYIDLSGCLNVTIRGCTFEGANPRTGREYIEAIQVDCSTFAGSSDKTEPTDTYDGLPTRAVSVTRCEFRPLADYPMPAPFGIHTNAREDEEGYYSDLAFTDNLVRGWTRETTDFWAGWVMLSGVRGGIIARNRFAYTGAAGKNSRGVVALRRATSATPKAQVAAESPTSVTVSRPCHGVTIADNTFTGFDSYWSTAGADWGLIGLYGSGDPTGIAITGNRINGCNGEAIRVYGGVTHPVVVSGNSGTALAAVRSQATHSLVYGNAFTGSTGAALGIGTSGSGAPVEVHANVLNHYATGIHIDAADNGLVQGNLVDFYTVAGIQIGQATGSTTWDVTVSGNRLRSKDRTDQTVSLRIGATATRAMRFGNRLRDGGPIDDKGSDTITAATDQTA